MNKLILSAAAILVVMTATLPISAQQSDQDWSRVETLTSGSTVIVEIRGGKTIKGKYSGSSGTDLKISASGRVVSVSKVDIDRVYRGRRGSLIKRMTMGALIGLGVGTAIGVAATVATKSDGLAAAAGVLYGVPVGAVIGATTGNKKRKGELLYLSR